MKDGVIVDGQITRPYPRWAIGASSQRARYLSTLGRVRPEHRERFAAAILTGDLARVHAVERD